MTPSNHYNGDHASIWDPFPMVHHRRYYATGIMIMQWVHIA